MNDTGSTPEIDALLEYLKRERGFDFTGYKRPGLVRRIERRMQTIGSPDFAAYLDLLEANPDEFSHLFNTVLINVTAFFRDADAWEYLAGTIVPQIVGDATSGEPIRVWSAGCATGQEAYSLAMVFAEALGTDLLQERVKIYATDVDEEALATARAGVYAERDVEGIPAPLLERYFTRTDSRYTFRKDLRRAVIFGRNDLVRNAPISHIDLLLCRNTLMYFDARTQAHMLARFHFALNEQGYLFLGRAETLLTHSETFVPVDLKRRIFARRAGSLGVRHRVAPPQVTREAVASPAGDDTRNVRELAFYHAGVAQIIVDQAGKLVLANERARSLFRLSGTDIGRPLQDLDLSYKPFDLRSAIDQAYAERRTIALRGMAWRTDVDERYFNLDVIPLPAPRGAVAGVTISFADITRQKELEREVETAQEELTAAYEELQSVNEELETTNEELQSTVEELETTNEELQSTNEELETMNSELQATNEQLHSTNDHLRDGGGEMTSMGGLQDSVFTSLRSGVIVVNRSLHVLLWNNWAEELWGVRAADVEGKALMDLDIGLPVRELRPAIMACLQGVDGNSPVTLDARNQRGETMTCQVTCLPLEGVGSAAAAGVILLLDQVDGEARTKAGRAG